MHDPLNVGDLVNDELTQRRESGYDVSALEVRMAETSSSDSDRLEELYLDLTRTRRRPDWAYAEPDTFEEILAALPALRQSVATAATAAEVGSAERADRILGGWLGRIAGCNLGKPIEDGDTWTPERIRDYLRLADAYPLRDYIPRLEPMPQGNPMRDCWPETTRGRIDGSARDDDIDYSILALWLLERHGSDLRPDHLAEAMLSFLPYHRVFTAERAAMVNLLNGVPVAATATTRNPYREWIGALIRADVYGWTNPGRPEAAARLAFADASLTHRANGIYGAIWAAALIAIAGTAASVRAAVLASLAWVPESSRLAAALHHVAGLHAAGRSWEAALESIRARFDHYSWVHTVNNACLITAGLLWGEEEYAAIVGLTVQGGWDTDSNGATAGSVAGTVLGAAALPPRFTEPLHDRTRSAVFGYDNSRISELARRTMRLIDEGRTRTAA